MAGSTAKRISSFGINTSSLRPTGVDIKFPPQGPYSFQDIRYYSRPEAVCGFMLSEYVRAFSVIPGQTFQVPVGVAKGGDLQTIDFFCNNVFLEYHPPRVFSPSSRRRKEPEAIYRLRKRSQDRRLPKELRKKYRNELRVSLMRQYMRERMHLLSHSPVVDSFQLVVAGSPYELYRDFLQHHATQKLPRYPVFERDFKELLKEVQDLRR